MYSKSGVIRNPDTNPYITNLYKLCVLTSHLRTSPSLQSIHIKSISNASSATGMWQLKLFQIRIGLYLKLWQLKLFQRRIGLYLKLLDISSLITQKVLSKKILSVFESSRDKLYKYLIKNSVPFKNWRCPSSDLQATIHKVKPMAPSYISLWTKQLLSEAFFFKILCFRDINL